MCSLRQSFLFTQSIKLYCKIIYVFSTIFSKANIKSKKALPKKTLCMTDIICTETILYRQEATIFHSILNKACKDANMILNDDVIDFKF